MKKLYRKADKGFSLIEVIIAMTILAFALAAIFTVFTVGTSDIDYGRRETIATTTAQEKMEELRSRHYADTLLKSDSDTVEINNFEVFRRWTVTENDSQNLKEISVEVKWQGRSSQKTYTIDSKKGKF
jgi:type II secretion system protein I